MTTPIRPPRPLTSPAVEVAKVNGHDAREDEIPRRESQADRIERVQLETAEMVGLLARDVAVVRADVDLIRHEQRRQADILSLQGLPAQRPPLDSVHDDDLEVAERTLTGQTPVYRVPAQQLAAIRETDVRHALREFAVGEAERVQVAVAAALTAQRETDRLQSAAAPILWFRGNATRIVIPILVAGILGIGAAFSSAFKTFVAAIKGHP